ncbi:UNVERIFIED_CONTAM: hypothetical protein LK11_01140 [Mumia flava]
MAAAHDHDIGVGGDRVSITRCARASTSGGVAVCARASTSGGVHLWGVHGSSLDPFRRGSAVDAFLPPGRPGARRRRDWECMRAAWVLRIVQT